jgi:hypothetical protein
VRSIEWQKQKEKHGPSQMQNSQIPLEVSSAWFFCSAKNFWIQILELVQQASLYKQLKKGANEGALVYYPSYVVGSRAIRSYEDP